MSRDFKDLIIYAKEEHVPIMLKDGIDFLCKFIEENNIKSILEIGTAIGYSAINFASLSCNVTTIEYNEKMYNEALKNIKKYNFEHSINIIFGDAKEVKDLVSDKTYDLIFIDAAKGSYQIFFDLYKDLLNVDGYIVCDNMDFHGLTSSSDLSNYSRGLRSMIRKLNKFKEDLFNNELYDTTYYNIGDGITISKKVKE